MSCPLRWRSVTFLCQAHNWATRPPQSLPYDKDYFMPFIWLLDRQQNTWNHIISWMKKRFDRYRFVFLNFNINLELQLERNAVQKEYPLHLDYFFLQVIVSICLDFSDSFFKGKLYENITVCAIVHVTTLNVQVRPLYIDFWSMQCHKLSCLDSAKNVTGNYFMRR